MRHRKFIIIYDKDENLLRKYKKFKLKNNFEVFNFIFQISSKLKLLHYYHAVKILEDTKNIS